MHTALLLIDIQNDYFQGGRCELRDPLAALAKARRILEAFRARNAPVFHIRHVNTAENAVFFTPGSFGAEIRAEVAPIPGEREIVKRGPNSFYRTELDKALKRMKIRRVVACGMMSHMCVDTTVRAAKELGYEIDLIEDACATKDLRWRGSILAARDVHGAFMAALDRMFAQVTTADQWLGARFS